MEKMEDKNKARNYGGQCQMIDEIFSNLKLEDAPGRERPYYVRTRKPRGTKDNGAGYVSKKHKETHKMKRDIKNQDILKKHTSSNSTLTLKIRKPRPDIGVKREIVYPPHLKYTKIGIQPFNSPYYPVDESQQKKVDYRSDIKPPPNYFFKMLNTFPNDTEYKQSNDTMNKHSEKVLSNQLFTPNRPEKLYLPCCLVEKEINSEEDLFSALHTSRIVDKTGCKFIMAEYNWSEKHLRLVQGLNILATCKNIDCTKHLEGVVCPRGWFPERKGYCPLDEEVFNAICPLCKISIIPDDSLGFGFYNCDFQLTYKLHKQPKHTTGIVKKENMLYFGKYMPLNGTLDILQVRMSV